jgi:hypothetical protein
MRCILLAFALTCILCLQKGRLQSVFAASWSCQAEVGFAGLRLTAARCGEKGISIFAAGRQGSRILVADIDSMPNNWLRQWSLPSKMENRLMFSADNS